MLDWGDLLAATALMLVFEGILPFIAPQGMRQTWLNLAQMNDQTLRMIGLASMLAGLVMLYFVRT